MTFCLRLTWNISGKVSEYRYETALERAIAMIGLNMLGDIETWEEVTH